MAQTLLQKLDVLIDRGNPFQIALYDIIKAIIEVTDAESGDSTILADIIREKTAGAKVSFPDNIKVDTVDEETTDAGVTIDSVLLKDNTITILQNIIKGLASTEGYGLLNIKSISASIAFSGGATEVIPVQVPAGVKIIGCQLRNDTILTATTGVSYSAAYSTGSTQAIGSGIGFTKNAKTNTFFDANADTDITTALTDVTLTPNAGTLDTGTVVAVVYYYELTTMTSAS